MAVQQEVHKAFQFTLDPRPAQVEALLRHAGAARWAFNHALGVKVAAHRPDAWPGCNARNPPALFATRCNFLASGAPSTGPDGASLGDHCLTLGSAYRLAGA
ncbi:helix-turn-helix domain-containing protein [Streptomyces monomycini]|uniref:helix-turn-helix domain-containing protein n=1 Tax=Streptomyces monomycini TaxID=371720 RepID=UPI0012FF2F7E